MTKRKKYKRTNNDLHNIHIIFVVVTVSSSFPLSLLIVGFSTKVKLQAPLMEQELPLYLYVSPELHPLFLWCSCCSILSLQCFGIHWLSFCPFFLHLYCLTVCLSVCPKTTDYPFWYLQTFLKIKVIILKLKKGNNWHFFFLRWPEDCFWHICLIMLYS